MMRQKRLFACLSAAVLCCCMSACDDNGDKRTAGKESGADHVLSSETQTEKQTETSAETTSETTSASEESSQATGTGSFMIGDIDLTASPTLQQMLDSGWEVKSEPDPTAGVVHGMTYANIGQSGRLPWVRVPWRLHSSKTDLPNFETSTVSWYAVGEMEGKEWEEDKNATFGLIEVLNMPILPAGSEYARPSIRLPKGISEESTYEDFKSAYGTPEKSLRGSGIVTSQVSDGIVSAAAEVLCLRYTLEDFFISAFFDEKGHHLVGISILPLR